MRGLILKDFYNMQKNIGPTMVTTICVGLLLMVQGNPSLFVIGFAIAGGGICSACLRMDETAGWTKFELTAPVSRAAVVIEKYVLLLFLTVIGLSLAECSAMRQVERQVRSMLQNLPCTCRSLSAFQLLAACFILFCLFKFG